MADTWREFWEELDAADAAWGHQAHCARLTLERVDGVQYRGVTPRGTWAARVEVSEARASAQGLPRCLLAEGRTPAELVLTVLALVRGQVPRG